MRYIPTIIVLLILTFALVAASPETGRAARVLTISEARRLALEFNRTYLAAKEQVVIANADVTRVRAGAFPRINLNGSYNRVFQIPSFFVQATDDSGVTETIEFKTGFKNSYGANLSITQPIWSGGRLFTALSAAKDYRSLARAIEDQVAAGVLYEADVLFHNVVLQQARLDVVQKSYEACAHNLNMIEKQFSQGLLSEYDVLRARVEKSNLQPQMLKAESHLRLARKRLKSFLGLELEEELQLVESPVEASPAALPSLDELIGGALQQRPEMRQAEFNSEVRRKAIRIARSDYFPSLSAIAAYDWQSQSDRFTLNENISRSWTAGLRLSIPIFQGGLVRGAVSQAIAEHNQAELQKNQTKDNIRLEVEEAYDHLLQAEEALDVQGNTIAEAEEGFRIANLRYETGIGTLLEVISSQAALTKARELLAEATFAYRTARAGFKLATTTDLDNMR